MKISEVVPKLLEAQLKWGDIEVFIPAPDKSQQNKAVKVGATSISSVLYAEDGNPDNRARILLLSSE